MILVGLLMCVSVVGMLLLWLLLVCSVVSVSYSLVGFRLLFF